MTKRSVLASVAVNLLLLLSLPGLPGLTTALADQACPAGKSCYYVPPVIPPPSVAPDSYGGDLLVASPQTAATGTYSISGGAAQSLSVTAGGSTRIAFDSAMVATAFHQALDQGLFLQSSNATLIPDERMTAKYWQSSATVKPSTVALGTRFRAGGYSLNAASGSDGTGWDYVIVYAPTAANVTASAPAGATTPFWGDSIATATTSFSLAAGQTFILRTRTGIDIDGALITSDAPVSVAAGGRGWSSGGCGDDGEDLLVPTDKFGSTFVVASWPATVANRVRVVADADGTQVQYTSNGTTLQTSTINAGQYTEFVPTAGSITLVTSSKPTIVFQNAGLRQCELDVAVVPPAVFANLASQTLTFNVLSGETGTVKVILPTTQAGSIQLDGAAPSGPTSATVPLHPEWTVVTIAVAAGTHTVSATSDFQLGLVAGDVGGTGLYGYPSAYRVAGCGDGITGTGEGCDDGNVSDGDGCSSVCQVETGSSCTGAPSTCGCTMDATCSNHTAGTYCATAASGPNTCATTGGNGSPIPTDHGTCGGASGPLGSPEAACSSGACNAANNTCAGTNGGSCNSNSQCATNYCLPVTGTCAPAGGCTVAGDCASDHYCDASHLCQPKRANATSCSSSGQCMSGICDTDMLCGYLNGTGTCTSSNAATVCRSGTCSPSSHACVAPTDGCVVDADCTNTYCGATTAGGVPSRCTTKLPNGQPIPSDTTHGGACSPTTALAVCASGVCGADNLCGLGLGGGPCTADAQCRAAASACITSGANAGKCALCSATNSGACGGATPLCDSTTNVCVGCAADYGVTGRACASASHPFCKSDGSCTACTSNADCAGAGHAGPICNLTTGACGDACAVNSDCGANQYCDSTSVCRTKKDSAATCAGAAECGSGICDTDAKCGYPVGHGPCANDIQCRTGTICVADGPNANKCETCSTARATACTAATPICGAANACVGCAVDYGVAGVACPSSAHALCNPDGSCGACTKNADCAGPNHAGPICDVATGACGSVCNVDGDCTAAEFCGTGHACQAKKESAATCTKAAQCGSGVCDTDGKCGFAVDGGPCSADSQCRPGAICAALGANLGKCEACSAERAATCANTTPLCDATDRCVACAVDYGVSGASCPTSFTPLCRVDGSCGKCASNADCGGASHPGTICDLTTGACGTVCSIDGDCDAAEYCGDSHACQAKKEGAATCTSASQCASGICDVDGKCGFAIDHGPCAADGDCRSGGLCVTDGPNAGKCETCAQGHAAACGNLTPFCDASDRCVACAADYGAAGAAACPTSASPLCRVDGACGRCATSADCGGAGHPGAICDVATGACGTACALDGDCAAKQYCGDSHACQAKKEGAATCTSASQCGSGVCDTDGKCGYGVDHGPCTTDSQCRAAGLCATTGPNSGKCEACAAGRTMSCTNTAPVCNTADHCVACTADYGGNGATCPNSANPLCRADGACGKCATNADCSSTVHAGAICDLTTGACGTTCAGDKDCGTGTWCNNPTGAAAGVCQPKISDGHPLPSGSCTTTDAVRLCASGTCDATTSTCGSASAHSISGGGGCSCEVGGGRSPSGVLGLTLLAVVGLLTGRRRTRP